MKLNLFILIKALLFLPLLSFTQISIGPLVGYDLSSVEVGEVRNPFGSPQTNGYENGSFLFGLELLQKFNNNIIVCFRSGYTEKKIGEPKVWSNYYY